MERPASFSPVTIRLTGLIGLSAVEPGAVPVDTVAMMKSQIYKTNRSVSILFSDINADDGQGASSEGWKSGIAGKVNRM